MDETLKTIRLIHNILIIISATLLAFLLSPDRSRQYEAALTELTALKQLTDDDYTSFVRSSIERERIDDFKRDIVKPKKFRVSDELKISVPFECEHFGKNTSLEDYYSFFEGPNRVVDVNLLPSVQMAEGAILKYRDSIPSDAILVDIAISIPKRKPPFDEKQEREMNGSDLKTTIQFTLKTVRMNGVYTAYDYPTVHMHGLSWGTSNSYYAIDWLRSKPDLYMQLVHDQPTSHEIFHNLRVFWNNVRALTINEAARLLQEKLDSITRQVSFLGISVEGSVIVWVGPLLTLLFVLYFLSHIRHLLSNLEQATSLISEFPWVGLFRDSVSKTLTYASIGLLPIVVNLILLWKTGHWKEATTILGCVFTVCLAILVTITTMSIRHLQIAIRSKKAGENTSPTLSA